MSSDKPQRPEWMSSISSNVDPDEYLSGRKIDKTFELSQQEKAERAKEIRTNLIAADKIKLKGDPMLDLERRKCQLKLEIISNPIRLRQFRQRLIEERRKEEGSSKEPGRDDKHRRMSNRDHGHNHDHRDRSPKRSNQESSHTHRSHRQSSETHRDRHSQRSPKREHRSRRRHNSRSPSRDRHRDRDNKDRHHHHHRSDMPRSHERKHDSSGRSSRRDDDRRR